MLIRVWVFFVQLIEQLGITLTDRTTEFRSVIALSDALLEEATFFCLQSVNIGEEDVGVVREVVAMEVVELQAIKGDEEIHDGG